MCIRKDGYNRTEAAIVHRDSLIAPRGYYTSSQSCVVEKYSAKATVSIDGHHSQPHTTVIRQCPVETIGTWQEQRFRSNWIERFEVHDPDGLLGRTARRADHTARWAWVSCGGRRRGIRMYSTQHVCRRARPGQAV
jgi:hypothetical protein